MELQPLQGLGPVAIVDDAADVAGGDGGGADVPQLEPVASCRVAASCKDSSWAYAC